MSLLKLPLLLSSAICYDISIGYYSPSHPEDRVAVRSVPEQMWMRTALPCSYFMKSIMYLAAVAESMVILGSLHGTHRSSDTTSVILNALGPTDASQLSVLFVLGACLVTAGGLIRLRCYRALGPYFTFVQCIRKDHKLVTTGPYAVVRHPAYAGLLMCMLGTCIMQGSPGSWLRASGVLGVPWVRAGFVLWWLIMGASVMTLFTRSTTEDRLLSERFGKEWQDWARRVKYKLMPFIY